jgi:diadenosine tetraphosphate (Ap4A) HIT family hydrolase
MDDCRACEVNTGRRVPPGGTIYQDDNWVAGHGMPALVRGYIVLKPKRHVHELADLLPSEAASLGIVAQRLLAAMRSALGPERVYVCSFAETVHHLHFHLLPRYAAMPGLGPSLMEALFSERWRCTVEEAAEAADRVRSELSSLALFRTTSEPSPH